MKLLTREEEIVAIDAGAGITLEGALGVPPDARGVVLFVHGSGSSRLSPRNNYVAGELRKAGLGTLLMDLLTKEEDADYQTRFNITLLIKRLESATGWLMDDERTKKLRIGYFGASTGAAAALAASVNVKTKIGAIVSRGGRVDLANEYLGRVKAPTLFIVGGHDDIVIELNRSSFELLKCEKDLVIVPGASHLFEEPGTLEQVSGHAAKWFKKHLEKK
ncbi:MAG: alpha/beta hydrolase [Deltaproteobacteria bacterium]|nr:alpha/beta hydrolase [Deltaproteobacteria bacterium]